MLVVVAVVVVVVCAFISVVVVVVMSVGHAGEEVLAGYVGYDKSA